MFATVNGASRLHINNPISFGMSKSRNVSLFFLATFTSSILNTGLGTGCLFIYNPLAKFVFVCRKTDTNHNTSCGNSGSRCNSNPRFCAYAFQKSSRSINQCFEVDFLHNPSPSTFFARRHFIFCTKRKRRQPKLTPKNANSDSRQTNL